MLFLLLVYLLVKCDNRRYEAMTYFVILMTLFAMLPPAFFTADARSRNR